MEVALVDFESLDESPEDEVDHRAVDETTALTLEMPPEQFHADHGPAANNNNHHHQQLQVPQQSSHVSFPTNSPVPSCMWESVSPSHASPSHTTVQTLAVPVDVPVKLKTPCRRGRNSCESIITNWKLLLSSEGTKVYLRVALSLPSLSSQSL